MYVNWKSIILNWELAIMPNGCDWWKGVIGHIYLLLFTGHNCGICVNEAT